MPSLFSTCPFCAAPDPNLNYWVPGSTSFVSCFKCLCDGPYFGQDDGLDDLRAIAAWELRPGAPAWVHHTSRTKEEVQAERLARIYLECQGFAYYDDPMEGGQNAYDISREALDKAERVIAERAA